MSDIIQNPIFCLVCARRICAAWKGWCSYGTEEWKSPQERKRLALPKLPEMQSGKCPACGGTQSISAEHIYYRNYHGPHNTGLPDHFELVLGDGVILSQDQPDLIRWGKPYREKRIPNVPHTEILADFIESNPDIHRKN